MRYKLDDLGWVQFEELCQSLLKATLGLRIESWGGSLDLGRDAYFAGRLQLVRGTWSEGPFVFQAKFVAGANAAGSNPRRPLLDAVKSEVKRISRRVRKRQWMPLSHYILLTNVPLTTGLRRELSTELSGLDAEVTVWGGGDLCDMLDDAPHIRSAFPQLLSLRDLDNILAKVVNKALVERSIAAIDEARALCPVFVPTAAYYLALETLKKHAFVVLTGAPEMGKTTIARMLGLAQLSENREYFDCFTPDDFFANINDDDVPQIFVADDAFGTTEYRPELAIPWGHQLPKIIRRLSPKRWLIWTSRPAPLHFALQKLHLEGKASDFPSPAEVRVDASTLEKKEKAQILYRHAKAANLSIDAKRVISQFGIDIVSNAHFTPERIRRFVTNRVEELAASLSEDGNDAEIIQDAVLSEIEAPTPRMMQSFSNIDGSHQNFMISLLDVKPGPSETEVSEAYYRIFRGDADVPPSRIAADLDGHFLRFRHAVSSHRSSRTHHHQGEATINWLHPSWRDITIDFLGEHMERRRTFLRRCSSEGLSLALSFGGGSEGRRVSPLLKLEDDWNTLVDKVQTIVGDESIQEIHQLAAVVSEAAANAEVETSSENQIDRVAVTFGDALIERAGKQELSFQSYHLGPIVQLCSAHSPDDMSILLSPTCRSYLSCIHDDTDAEDAQELTESLIGFFSVASLVEKYAPSLLESIGFPDDYADMFIKGAEVFGAYSASIDVDDDSVDLDSLEESEVVVDGMRSVCDEISGWVPSAQAAAGSAVESL